MALILTLTNSDGSVKTFYTNTEGSSPGYKVQVQYDSVTRSGTTVTMNNAKLVLTRNVGTYGTLNRIACKVGVGGSETNVKNNATIHESQGDYSSGTESISLGSPSIKNHTGTTFSIYVSLASTGWSDDWDNFQGGSPVSGTLYADCPAAYPTFTVQPSATNITETTLTLNPGVTDVTSKFYYKLSTQTTWTEISSATTITGLAAGTAYTINVQARNSADTSLTTDATDVSATTLKYPYIMSITTGKTTSSRSIAGENQTVSIYNPLKRDIVVCMDNGSKGGTNIYTSSTISDVSHTFTIPLTSVGSVLGATGTTGTAIYYVKYGTQSGTTITGYYQITQAYAKPAWPAALNVANLIKFKDGNNTSAARTGSTDSNPILLQKYSKLFVGLNAATYGATPQYGTTIDKYQISINSGTYVNYTGSTSATTGVQDIGHTVSASATSVTVTVKAIDKRGFVSDTKTLTIPVTKYSAPTGLVTFERKGGYGTAAKVTVSPTWGYAKTSGEEKATIITRLQGSTTTIETLSLSSLTTSKSIDATKVYDNEKVYECVVTLTDAFSTSTTNIIGVMIEGQPIFFIDSEIGGVGVNCFPTKQGLTLPSNKPLIMNDLQFKTLKCSTASIGSTQYFKIGTWTTTQNGKKLRIQGSGAMGYNANTGQIYSFEIVVNTSNGSAHATYGYFKAMANITNDTGRELLTFKIYLVQNSSTSCDIWMEQSAYDSRYLTIMFDNADSFTLSGVMSETAPTTNYIISARTLVDQIYPVGSIYVSTKETSPSSLFGGNWTKIKDKFLYATSATGDAGKNGGSSTTSYTPAGTISGTVQGHALTIKELAKHSHVQMKAGDSRNHHLDVSSSNSYSTIAYSGDGTTATSYQTDGIADYYQDAWGSRYPIATQTTGIGDAHSHGFSGSFTGTPASLSINPAHYTVHAWVRIS